MELWDGRMRDGTFVFDSDRKSGLNFTTPSASFDTPGPGTAPNMRPLLQLSCSGELGINLLSGNLQLAVHAPIAQDLIGFFAQKVRELQEARRANWGALKSPAAQLSGAQFEVRYMLHHVAHWLYQYTGFGSDTMAQSSDNWGGNSPGGGFGANLFSDLSVFTDVLQLFNWSRREPTWPQRNSDTPASPSATPGTLDWRRTSDWAKAWRMEAPTADCSLQSALTGVDAEYEYLILGGVPGAQASRRCRFSWGGLANLLGNRAGGISDLLVHADVSHDVCQGAATGARPPVASTLSRTTAAYALPSASVYIQGSLASLIQAPRPCATRLDCDAIPGVPADQVDCVDLDRRLLTLSNLFTGKDVNPFAEFSIGSYNTGGQRCGGAEDLRGSLRTLVRSLGGMRRDDPFRTSPSFCMYSPTRVADFVQSGNDGRRAIFDERRTCALQNYSDPRRLCLASTMPAQPALGLPFATVVTGNPVRINSMYGAPVVAPRPGVGGVEPFTPSSRIGSTPGFVGNGGTDADFTISIPAITRARFTNNWKERLRWGLAQALSQFGVPTPPEAVLIKSVTDNGDAFSPLPGGGRAGVTVLFAVESPDAATRRNVTAQFESSLPGTLAHSAGPVFAALGIVPQLFQSEVQFRERTKPLTSTSASATTASSSRVPSPSCRPDLEASRDRCRCKRDEADVSVEYPGGRNYCGAADRDANGQCPWPPLPRPSCHPDIDGGNPLLSPRANWGPNASSGDSGLLAAVAVGGVALGVAVAAAVFFLRRPPARALAMQADFPQLASPHSLGESVESGAAPSEVGANSGVVMQDSGFAQPQSVSGTTRLFTVKAINPLSSAPAANRRKFSSIW